MDKRPDFILLEDEDPLRAAKGIMWGAVLGGLTWGLIAAIWWVLS
jgi:hypothetical protein